MVARPQSDSKGHYSPEVCDVCESAIAGLRYEDCHLDLCVACSRARHVSSLHLTRGRFRFYRQTDLNRGIKESPSTNSLPNLPTAEELRYSPQTTIGVPRDFDDALAHSLRALSFATDEESCVDSATPSASMVKTTTSLALAEKQSHSFSNSLMLGDTDHWRTPTKTGELIDLFDAMKTNFASRHVVLRCVAGAFDASDVCRVVDRLSNFGSVASMCCELSTKGLLFCTFYDLMNAVAAVERWPTNSEILCFCLPYELPDDINSATLLLRFARSRSSASMVPSSTTFVRLLVEWRPDMQVAKFIVEYSDSRVLPAALNGLPGAFYATMPPTVARTTPPTLDFSKLQLFLDCLNKVAITHSRVARPRPNSFSSSTTSLLTSPTSSVASSLNASYLDGAENISPMASAASVKYPGELTSPVLTPQDEQHIRATPVPRARSNSSSAYLGGMLSSSNFGNPAYPHRFSFPSSSALSGRAVRHTSFWTTPLLQSLGNHVSSRAEQCQHSYYANNEQQSTAVSMRGCYSNNDRVTRMSPANCGHVCCSSTRSTAGRHDQGTGEFSLSIEKVASGEDRRTTLMIRNIPNKYTQHMLLAEINRNHLGNYDFFYLPIDFKNKCNMGYAFINFIEALHIERFHKEFDGQKWTNFNSEKVCAISYARLQGKQAMVARFQNSSLLDKHESYRPLVFSSFGSNRGKPEPFPVSNQIAQRKPLHPSGMSRVDDNGGSYGNHQTYSQAFLQQPQQHSYSQQFLELRQHPLTPSLASNVHFGMQVLPSHYIPMYQQNEAQLASPLVCDAGMPSDDTR
ncbi:hypothetical protein CCR75_007989 [Bremia lactucae]|uniref:Mei2-like C-terminal RNA recognition motif domain-containing protein n=1 Tax=Bremia lactucae TaxID=4779 RepID=A0A976FJ03_BRELC|nr:hypothetical protein CCR75_007989 [Bremia lactucae]